VDLVEEVARIAGYADIPSVLPAAPAGEGLTKPQRLRRSVARSLADFGLVQVLSYPFVGEDTFNALGYSPEDPRRSALKLANPLDMQAPYLRTEVLQTLLATARRNVGRGNTDLALYELGLVWERPSGELYAPILRVDARPSEDELAALEAAVPAQPRHVAGVLVGQWQTGGIWGPGRAVDWADAVEAAQVVARAVHLELTVEQAQQAPFHPGRCARLLVAGQTVGYAGELDPRILPIWDLPPGVAAFELDLDALVQAAPSLVEARPVSAWPVAKEDLALVVDQGLPVADLVAALAQGADSLLEEARVFDVYQGDQIPEDKKSVAVALRLRAADHTLSSEEIARARQEAIQAAAAAVGAELRA
jgi:phenylalanyl-tRNA synthetase beta chain